MHHADPAGVLAHIHRSDDFSLELRAELQRHLGTSG
jgi:hypothetical protein